MGSFLVIGMGRFGSSVATELHRMKHDVLAVDESEDAVNGIVDSVTDVIIGDVRDEAVLRSMGVQNFDCVVVAIGDAIEGSVLTTIMLKEMGAKKIICKAQNEWHAKILAQLGADKIIRPEFDIGKRVAHSLAQHNILDYLELSQDYGIVDISTPAKWTGKSMASNNLRRKYGITVIAVRSATDDTLDVSPSADRVLTADDILTVIGSTRDLDKIGTLD